MLSSHIMQEVEAVCERALIIHNGRIVADGSVEELKNSEFSNHQLVVAEFSGKVELSGLQEIDGVAGVTFENGKWFIEAVPGKDIRPGIFHFAVNNNLILLSMQESRQSLENVFRNLTR